MAKVIGQIDSLTNLLSSLKENGIREFQSLQDIIDFKGSYSSKILELEKSINKEILNEIEDLNNHLTALSNELDERLREREIHLINEKNKLPEQIERYSKRPDSFFKSIQFYFIRFHLQKRLKTLLNHFDYQKRKPFRSLEKGIQHAKRKLDYANNYSDQEIKLRLKKKSKSLIKTKNILDKYNDLFLGAIGEDKAVKRLKNLPDSFTIINGFNLSLDSPFYNKKTNDRIYSIQADHIVIGPTGIFLIETKNWSQSSSENSNYYSPVEQVKRSGYTLYRYLNDSINKGIFTYFTGIWTRKVSIRNIVLMVNFKPTKKYDYVKILGLSEVNNYITYFDKIYDEKMVQQLIKHLT